MHLELTAPINPAPNGTLIILIKYFAQLDKDNQFILYTDQPLSPDLADFAFAGFFLPAETKILNRSMMKTAIRK